MNQDNQVEKAVSLKEFKMFAGSIVSVWYALDMKGNYFPHLSSSVMTSEHLLEVVRGKVFKIEKKNIQKCTLFQKHPKLISKLSQMSQQKKLTKGSWIHSQQRVANFRSIGSKFSGFSVFETQNRGCWASNKKGFRLDTALFHPKKPGFLKRIEEQRIVIAEKRSEQNCSLKQKVDKKRFDSVHSTYLLANKKNNLKRREKLKMIKQS